MYYVEETLKWSEVAKTGSKKDREKWWKNKYDLFCHNIGSSQIYSENNFDEIVRILIKTHGLVGQYLKGEVNLNKNIELYNLVKNKKLTDSQLYEILTILNRCIIEAISYDLYNDIIKDIEKTIKRIISGDLEEENNIIDRFIKLNKSITIEDKKLLENLDENIKERLINVFDNLEIWYFEATLSEFKLEEQIKILLLINNKLNSKIKHITFESLMKSVYLDYKNEKNVNLYKKRIIEKYLENINFIDIINKNISENPHISYNTKIVNSAIEFNFKFSIPAKKLIEFCEVAGNSDALYQNATYMLHDLFGFRKDSYDRFYNELNYLNTMNSAKKEKSIILDYIVGKNILDVVLVEE